eukprot:366321-Chlamydomonas_euryale.AAC.11
MSWGGRQDSRAVEIVSSPANSPPPGSHAEASQQQSTVCAAVPRGPAPLTALSLCFVAQLRRGPAPKKPSQQPRSTCSAKSSSRISHNNTSSNTGSSNSNTSSNSRITTAPATHPVPPGSPDRADAGLDDGHAYGQIMRRALEAVGDAGGMQPFLFHMGAGAHG